MLRFGLLRAALLLMLMPVVPSWSQDAGSAARGLRPLPRQRILFNGDSIFKGYGFGNYTDPSPLRTVYKIVDLLMKENVVYPPETVWLAGVWTGLNPDGTPKTVDTLAGEIQTYIRRGDIRTGDWMIYEDAGQLDMFVHPAPWPDRIGVYQKYRKALRDMVLQGEHAIDREHIRFMTMFDYQPKCGWCAWDAPLDDGVHTGNDAIRDEAEALGIEWIDMNRIMDRAQEHVQARGWGRLVGPDGIHPNVYGNFVMALAIAQSLGADVSKWKLDSVAPRFRHPEQGGDVKAVWGFTRDPGDAERIALLEELRQIVVREGAAPKPRASAGTAGVAGAHTFRRLVHHGRILDHPARQPEGTTKPASYELGKLFQLDPKTLLLVASLREQGGHDFAIGNDGFIFRDLSEIVPERAVPINRLEPDHRLPSGAKSVLAKYPVGGAFVPLGAVLENGQPHPGAGTGFLLSSCGPFLPDRSEMVPNAGLFIELLQLRWDGNSLKVTRDTWPEPYASRIDNLGFNCLAKNGGFLCPMAMQDGQVQVVRFEAAGGRWQPVEAGKPFATKPKEFEPSIVELDGEYLVYTRGSNRRGRVYRSGDGLNYYLRADHWNHTVPQVLNQGLDGSVYLTTNTGPGWLRNPLLAFAMRGVGFVDPVVVHDEKEIGDDKEREVPFCDHGIGTNVLLNDRWRHLLLYRVCDLRETNGEGAPPMPQTGLYLAELEYDRVTRPPFRLGTR